MGRNLKLLELPEDIQAFLERKREFFYVLSQNFIALMHVLCTIFTSVLSFRSDESLNRFRGRGFPAVPDSRLLTEPPRLIDAIVVES